MMAWSLRWKSFSSWERYLIAIVAAVVLLCIILVIVMGAVLSIVPSCDLVKESFGTEASKSLNSNSNLCLTPTCIHVASQILENMDTNVDPCDNFYKFACGNFLKKVAIPHDKQKIDSFTKAGDTVVKQLRKIIEASSMQNERRFSRLVHILYNSCMNRRRIERQGHEPLLTMLKKLGGWPVLEGATWDEKNFHWATLTYKLREEGLTTDHYIDLIPYLDVKNVSRTILYVSGATFSIPREILATEDNPTIRKMYQELMIDIAVLLGANRKAAKEQLTAAHEFEKKLAVASSTSDYRGIVALKYVRSYHLTTLKILSKTNSSIPWKEYIERFVAPKVIAKEDEVINVQVPQYISKLETFIAQTPKRVQANYILWRVVMKSIHYLTENLRERYFKFASVVLGVTGKEARWQECLHRVTEHMPFGMGSLYVKKYVRKETKKSATEMYKNIKDEMNIRLQRVSWMDPPTRVNALRKISGMQSLIAYPEELLDEDKIDEFFKELQLRGGHYWENSLSITRFKTNDAFARLRQPFDRSDWRNYGDVTEINAFYTPRRNTIAVGGAILQRPYFDENQPQYLNYGAIGVIIGHEITHGFDSSGRYYGPAGNILDWWTDHSRQKFNQQIHCIIDQYNNYTVPEAGLNVDGKLTRDENIADNGGIKLSYLAYKKWASMHKKEGLLPGLDFTQSQLFWFSTANMFCTNYLLYFLKWKIQKEVHCPSEFRIIGSFSNTAEFAKDFKCRSGTTMNPKHKCTTW